MGMPPLRLEVMPTIDRVAFSECYKSRMKTVWDGIEIDVISREHLLANKRASGRSKDLTDIEHLTS